MWSEQRTRSCVAGWSPWHAQQPALLPGSSLVCRFSSLTWVFFYWCGGFQAPFGEWVWPEYFLIIILMLELFIKVLLVSEELFHPRFNGWVKLLEILCFQQRCVFKQFTEPWSMGREDRHATGLLLPYWSVSLSALPPRALWAWTFFCRR